MSLKISELQKARAAYYPKLPEALKNGAKVKLVEGSATESIADQEKVKAIFKNTYGAPVVKFEKGDGSKIEKPINVGVILSGGQAPGGHNVISGIFDGLKSLNPNSKLYGFLGGPSGYIKNEYIELTENFIKDYRNTGGFDIIGSGRTKLETDEQFEAGRKNCEKLGISAVVIIGGDDSNTNACLLAEYYKAKNIPINVIGCPKTIDGDLKNEHIETSFGFDTATKVYSELIGNIARDSNSAKKYWHFIKLMGRSASHIALECALKTQPNITLVSEEIEEQKLTLAQVVGYMASIVAKRAEKGNNFGIALIPEGLIEFIPEVKSLIAELNDLIAHKTDEFNNIASAAGKRDFIKKELSPTSASVYKSLPEFVQNQLVLDRDPHGNVQVSLIETEKLLIEMVAANLKSNSAFKGSFKALNHFFGYEGRCAAPSNFDADYCYSLGFNAAALIGTQKTGYMSSVKNLTRPASEWVAGGIPITMMMNIEKRHGKDKPVIQKALVDLNGKPFKKLAENREKWAVETNYIYPGPIQYFGPSEVCDITTETIRLENS